MEYLVLDTHTARALLEIVMVNTLLSGDNAVVIALSCRNLPGSQRKKAIAVGTFIAVILRVFLTLCAGLLLAMPFLKLAGSLLLFLIAVKFLAPDHGESGESKSIEKFWPALRTVILADLVMSLDNVVGVAAAAKGENALLVVGLLMSMPLIIFGSTFIIRLLGRFPALVTGGAALLGYVAGEMAISDAIAVNWIHSHIPMAHILVPLAAAAGAVIAGKTLGSRRAHRILAVEAGQNVRQNKQKPREG